MCRLFACPCCPALPRPAVPSPSDVNVTCQGPWSGNFTVDLQASAGVAGCDDTAEAEVPVRVIPLPAVSLSGAATRAVCANSGSITLSFNASAILSGAGVPWSLSFTNNVAGVSCESKSGTGECHVGASSSTRFDINLKGMRLLQCKMRV